MLMKHSKTETIEQKLCRGGWVFGYDHETGLVYASHPKGGELLICEVPRMTNLSWSEAFGQAIARYLNGQHAQAPERAFRELRGRWFVRALFSDAPEREWEDGQDAERRDMRNEKLKQEYDKQTERILEGDDSEPIAPRSANEVMI